MQKERKGQLNGELRNKTNRDSLYAGAAPQYPLQLTKGKKKT